MRSRDGCKCVGGYKCHGNFKCLLKTFRSHNARNGNARCDARVHFAKKWRRNEVFVYVADALTSLGEMAEVWQTHQAIYAKEMKR